MKARRGHRGISSDLPPGRIRDVGRERANYSHLPVVPAAHPADSLADIIAMAKASPGKVTHGIGTPSLIRAAGISAE